MKKLRILSGGAAQGLVNALAPRFEAETGIGIEGEFGAVGAMAAKLRAGAPADLLILTSALIDELTRQGHARPGTAADVGTVQTGIAIRAGDPAPPVADAAGLRAALVGADAVYLPDPVHATAGIHFGKVLRALGVWDELEPRLRTFPNGATAMRALAAAESARPIGCTQITEILNTPGVALVGPLPQGCELATVYTAALCTGAASAGEARRLIELLTSDASLEARRRAGFA